MKRAADATADFIVLVGCLFAFALFAATGMSGNLPGQCDEPAERETLLVCQGKESKR